MKISFSVIIWLFVFPYLAQTQVWAGAKMAQGNANNNLARSVTVYEQGK